MNIQPNASYLSEPLARSRTCGHFFMGSTPKNGEPIILNGAIYVHTSIMRFVVASAAEAELGQDRIIFRMTLMKIWEKKFRTVPVKLLGESSLSFRREILKDIAYPSDARSFSGIMIRSQANLGAAT